MHMEVDHQDYRICGAGILHGAKKEKGRKRITSNCLCTLAKKQEKLRLSKVREKEVMMSTSLST